jgi:hypothetical protein
MHTVIKIAVVRWIMRSARLNLGTDAEADSGAEGVGGAALFPDDSVDVIASCLPVAGCFGLGEFDA